MRSGPLFMTARSDMDIFSKIRDEHKRILRTMDELIGSAPDARRDSINDLAMQIMAHMNAEERTIFPAFEALESEPRSVAIQNAEEHQVARYLLNGLRDQGLNDETWAAKLRVFRNVLNAHIESEERVMLDQALGYFTQEEIDHISKRYEEVEAELFKKSRIDVLM